MLVGIRPKAVVALGFVLLAVPLAACGGTITDKGYIAATIEVSVAEERANVNVPVMLST